MVVVVMPALNEQDTLAQACASLGFGDPARPARDDRVLVVVDNGSSDATTRVAEEIKRRHRSATVFLAAEPKRGHVYPRATGMRLVEAVARRRGVNPADVIVLQADADTVYSEGYVDALVSALPPQGWLLEGRIEYPESFLARYPSYRDVTACFDDAVLDLIGPTSDYVVVDAVAAFRLSDYLLWGGHQAEVDERGQEVLAETTRLFMSGCAHGARKRPVPEAVAFPSTRKLFVDASVDLATAGYPADALWTSRWRRAYKGPRTVEDLVAAWRHPHVASALRWRERYLVGLFGLLPWHVNRALGLGLPPTQHPMRPLFDAMPVRDRQALLNAPGKFIQDALRATEGAATGWAASLEPCLPTPEGR